MKIDFSRVLKDFRTGEDMNFQAATADTPAKPLTLGFVCSEALLLPDQTERDVGKKTDDLVLAMKVFGAGEVEISTEEATRMKNKIAAAYPSALVAGQACQWLNG